MLLNCGIEENSWEYLGLQANQSSQSWRKSVLNIDWCWSFNTFATWCKSQPIERPWCWKRSNVGGEENYGMRWLDDISEWMDMSLSKLQGAGDRQGSLACCSPWGHKELDTTEQLKWTELRRGSTAPVLWGAGMCAHLWGCHCCCSSLQGGGFIQVAAGSLGSHSTLTSSSLQRDPTNGTESWLLARGF